MTRVSFFFFRAARHPADSDGMSNRWCPGTGQGTKGTIPRLDNNRLHKTTSQPRIAFKHDSPHVKLCTRTELVNSKKVAKTLVFGFWCWSSSPIVESKGRVVVTHNCGHDQWHLDVVISSHPTSVYLRIYNKIWIFQVMFQNLLNRNNFNLAAQTEASASTRANRSHTSADDTAPSWSSSRPTETHE